MAAETDNRLAALKIKYIMIKINHERVFSHIWG